MNCSGGAWSCGLCWRSRSGRRNRSNSRRLRDRGWHVALGLKPFEKRCTKPTAINGRLENFSSGETALTIARPIELAFKVINRSWCSAYFPWRQQEVKSPFPGECNECSWCLTSPVERAFQATCAFEMPPHPKVLSRRLHERLSLTLILYSTNVLPRVIKETHMNNTSLERLEWQRLRRPSLLDDENHTATRMHIAFLRSASRAPTTYIHCETQQ